MNLSKIFVVFSKLFHNLVHWLALRSVPGDHDYGDGDGDDADADDDYGDGDDDGDDHDGVHDMLLDDPVSLTHLPSRVHCTITVRKNHPIW